jgi:hypothetical protein
VPDFLQNLVIGVVSVPVFGALLLWAFQKVGLPVEAEVPAKFVIALALAGLVIFGNFFPQFNPNIVFGVALVYQILAALKSVVEGVAVKFADHVEVTAKAKAKLFAKKK